MAAKVSRAWGPWQSPSRSLGVSTGGVAELPAASWLSPVPEVLHPPVSAHFSIARLPLDDAGPHELSALAVVANVCETESFRCTESEDPSNGARAGHLQRGGGFLEGHVVAHGIVGLG